MNKYKLRRFTCLGCGKEVILRRSQSKTKYCSLACYRSSKRPQRKTGEIVKCFKCGKEIYKPKNQLDRSDRYFCSQSCANIYQKETDQKDEMRANGVKSIISQLNNKSETGLEKIGRSILQEIGIGFSEQVPMFEKFIVDVLIDDKKTVIQWDGEYWHSKKINKDRDNSQDKYLAKCGYKVLRYTDKQIKKDREAVKQDIIKRLSQ